MCIHVTLIIASAKCVWIFFHRLLSQFPAHEKPTSHAPYSIFAGIGSNMSRWLIWWDGIIKQLLKLAHGRVMVSHIYIHIFKSLLVYLSSVHGNLWQTRIRNYWFSSHISLRNTNWTKFSKSRCVKCGTLVSFDRYHWAFQSAYTRKWLIEVQYSKGSDQGDPHCRAMGYLYCEHFSEHWPCYNGTALY